MYRLSATTMATGSPAWRTLPRASGTWVRWLKIVPSIGGGGTSSGPGFQ